MLGLDHLPVGDHSALWRRAQTLKVLARTNTASRPTHLIVDSTGLQIVGEGPWAAAKHGMKGARDWRKLHVGVNERDFIVEQCLTEGRVNDASVVRELLRQVKKRIKRFIADGADDKTAVHDLLTERGAEIVLPPTNPSRERLLSIQATHRRQTQKLKQHGTGD